MFAGTARTTLDRPGAQAAHDDQALDSSSMIAPRPRLAARLDQVVATSRISLVEGPVGAGKTAVVSWWRDQVADQGPPNTWWLDASADLDASRTEAGLPGELLRSNRRAGSRRLGLVLERPSVVVLDNCPSGSPDLADDLGWLLHHTRPDVRFVLLGRRPLALDLHALGVAGEVLPITGAELDLDDAGIARILARHGQDPTEHLVSAVRRCTDGWASGVQIAAYALQRRASVDEALREADRTVSALVWTTALAPLPPEVLRLLVATSVLPEVPPDLAAAVLDEPVDTVVDALDVPSGFVEQDLDGTFRCHPLLRRILLQRLSRTPGTRRLATQRAARWLQQRGEGSRVLDLAAQAEDWDWVGRELVETLQVPRLLVGDCGQPLGDGQQLSNAAAAVPLVRAALAVQRGWLDVVDSALAAADAGAGAPVSGSTSQQFTAALTRLVAAAYQGRIAEGLQQLTQVDQLMPRLSLPQRAATPELVPLLQSARGMLELWSGAPDRARRAWETGARGFHPRAAHRSLPAQLAAADCLGQLAFLEAVAGETNRALRHVGDVLAAGPASRGRTGVAFAQLAAVWAQLNGAELEAAGGRLDAVVERCCGTGDAAVPAGLAASIALAGAKQAAVTGSGQVAGNVSLLRGGVLEGWFAEKLVAIRAEAELFVGEPASAVQLLAAADVAGTDSHVLRALALVELGDLGSAAACLRSRPVDAISTVNQVQIELIEARLTMEGDRRHVRSLVDRALRAAQREVLRTPIAWAKPWLGPVVVADPLLVQRYGAFLASIRPPAALGSPVVPVAAIPRSAVAITEGLAEPLSRRELEVLQRLGSMSTNTEIAAELFLSVNTVKTHLNAVYRKLEVNRRSAAVRRGRELGLC